MGKNREVKKFNGEEMGNMEIKNQAFQPIHNPYNPYDFKTGRSYYNKAVTQRIKEEFEAVPPQKIIFIQGSEGSGKSSTLNRVINDSQVLGERFLTLYIHADDIISGGNSNMVINLYDCLRKSINKYVINAQNDISNRLKVKISREDFQELFSILESVIDCNYTLVLLIFDDFDNILELESKGEAPVVMGYLRHLLEQKTYIRIILSGRGEVPDSLKYTPDGCCQENSALAIKMKMVDIPEFNRAITQPVEDRVSYSEKALEKIREITGGNLYCQQLLCYYIIFHLNNEERTHCDVDDVCQAAEFTIQDVREDFNYFWEKLEVQDKLVCSAIMDSSVVRKSGSCYFIEQSSLLHEVFETEELKAIMTRLFQDDFIIKINGRRFDAFPFKIPLYGNWIRHVHPFAHTIVDHIETVARQKSLSALGTIVEKIPLFSFPSTMQNTIRFIGEWSMLRKKLKEHGRVNRDDIEIPLRTLCSILDLARLENGVVSTDYFSIDFKKMDIGTIEEALFFIQDRQDPGKEDIQHLKDTILSDVTPTKPCLFFCLKRNDRIEELVQKTFLNIILIDDEDVKHMLFSSRPRQTLKEMVFRRISISQISPYKTDGPAVVTFYGRNKEIRKILGSTRRSFAILGARKIGKSSLLRRLVSGLQEMGAYAIFMDLESPANPDYRAFLQRCEDEFSRIFQGEFQFNDDLDRLSYCIKELPRGNKKIAVILDEIDELLLYDREHDYRLIKCFRSLFQEGYCQFIFSGFEVLQNVKRDIESPLYNFCEEILLGPLEEKYAMDLILEPMANMGVSFPDNEAIGLILEYTASHPNLIQFFCKHLVENLDENAETNRERLVLPADIHELFNFQYDNYIINDFYMYYNGLDELEKLVVILLYEIHGETPDFSVQKINHLLRNCGIDMSESRIHKTLQKLVLRFILIDMGKGKYRFALPHFPRMLSHRVEPALKSSIIQRVKGGHYGQSV